jgi:hypothetical protein
MNIIFDIMNITMDLMQLISTSSLPSLVQQTINDILFWFNQLIIDSGEAIKSFGTVIFKAIFESSPLGVALKDVIQQICIIVQWLLNNVWGKFLCPVVQAVLPTTLKIGIELLKIVNDILKAINSFTCSFGACLPGTEIIQIVIDQLTYVKEMIENGGLQCERQFNMCSQNTTYDQVEPNLPVASSCWAGYQPSAGDSSVLSCTRADTCFNPFTTDKIICDACPLQKGEDFLSFACSSLTKKCTCGVQRYERTRCTSHEQCYSSIQDSVCMRMDNIFSIAYSTTPCKECPTQQICVVTGPDRPGDIYIYISYIYIYTQNQCIGSTKQICMMNMIRIQEKRE